MVEHVNLPDVFHVYLYLKLCHKWRGKKEGKTKSELGLDIFLKYISNSYKSYGLDAEITG